jgi:hypothetical protein
LTGLVGQLTLWAETGDAQNAAQSESAARAKRLNLMRMMIVS